ncbi:hypothetical protein [Maribacter dokdonensis]|nr:hypothetical protein [Maribacter dokdonensis]
MKRKVPRWFRLIRYGLNCMWYHVLMPLGQEDDEFKKSLRK